MKTGGDVVIDGLDIAATHPAINCRLQMMPPAQDGGAGTRDVSTVFVYPAIGSSSLLRWVVLGLETRVLLFLNILGVSWKVHVRSHRPSQCEYSLTKTHYSKQSGVEARSAGLPWASLHSGFKKILNFNKSYYYYPLPL